jgi:hypothetical protein
MHDIKALEELGIPSVCIATTEFVNAAALQSAALGFDPAVVFVPHPIQDRSTAELRTLADETIERILAELADPATTSASA